MHDTGVERTIMTPGGTINLVITLIPPKKVFLTETRLSTLSHTARSKRPYQKSDTEYWTTGIMVFCV